MKKSPEKIAFKWREKKYQYFLNLIVFLQRQGSAILFLFFGEVLFEQCALRAVL
jgi:hypothetical protein